MGHWHQGQADCAGFARLERFALSANFIIIANSDASRPGIPISFRPPFRFEAGHHSEMKPAA